MEATEKATNKKYIKLPFPTYLRPLVSASDACYNCCLSHFHYLPLSLSSTITFIYSSYSIAEYVYLSHQFDKESALAALLWWHWLSYSFDPIIYNVGGLNFSHDLPHTKIKLSCVIHKRWKKWRIRVIHCVIYPTITGR